MQNKQDTDGQLQLTGTSKHVAVLSALVAAVIGLTEVLAHRFPRPCKDAVDVLQLQVAGQSDKLDEMRLELNKINKLLVMPPEVNADRHK